MNKALGITPSPLPSETAARDSQVRAVQPAPRPVEPELADASRAGAVPPLATIGRPLSEAGIVPDTLAGRLTVARERLRDAAHNGVRIRVYEVALDLDMSEFHFARQFRAAFGCSPHVFYDEVRASRARALLDAGLPQGQVARLIGLRRPAELRALLSRRQGAEAVA